jgi:hypothetical protein
VNRGDACPRRAADGVGAVQDRLSEMPNLVQSLSGAQHHDVLLATQSPVACVRGVWHARHMTAGCERSRRWGALVRRHAWVLHHNRVRRNTHPGLSFSWAADGCICTHHSHAPPHTACGAREAGCCASRSLFPCGTTISRIFQPSPCSQLQLSARQRADRRGAPVSAAVRGTRSICDESIRTVSV